MLNRYSLAFSIACILAANYSAPIHAMDSPDNNRSLAPVKDPLFSGEKANIQQAKGKLLLDALDDLESIRADSRQSASEARQEAARLLAFDWELQIQTDEKGQLKTGSSKYLFGSKGVDDSRDTVLRIPKGVVLLAVQIQQNEMGTVDSGQGSSHAGLTQDELDLICGPDWIVTWLEDEDGNMIPGSAELYCGGQSFPLG